MKKKNLFPLLLISAVFIIIILQMKYSSKPIRKEVVPNQIQKKIIASIGPQELNKMMKKKDFFLLDIYYPEQKHIIGTDRYIPFDQIVTRSKDLPKDKSKKIIIYCKNGSLV